MRALAVHRASRSRRETAQRSRSRRTAASEGTQPLPAVSSTPVGSCSSGGSCWLWSARQWRSPTCITAMDEEIRARIESKLADHYPNLIVRVRFAQLIARRGNRSSRPVDQRAERRRSAARAGLFRRDLFQLPDDDAGAAERRSGLHARSAAPAGAADDAAARRLVERGQAAAAAQARARPSGDEDRKRHDRGFRSAQEPLHHAFAARHPSDAQAACRRTTPATSNR